MGLSNRPSATPAEMRGGPDLGFASTTTLGALALTEPNSFRKSPGVDGPLLSSPESRTEGAASAIMAAWTGMLLGMVSETSVAGAAA